jgi:hypothetical protein
MIPKDLLPNPALRIGITGRRALKTEIGESGDKPESTVDVTEKMRTRVSEVLKAIQDASIEEFKKARDFYQRETPIFRAVSPLAEGADRVFAEEAKRLGYELECPLPFYEDEYVKDFVAPGSKARFDQLLNFAGDRVLELDGQRLPDPAESAAYEAVGRLVVDQCDLLIAIWDGKPDNGWGGTSGIIDFAANNIKVPVICLRMDRDSIEIYGRAGRRRPEEYSINALRRLIEHIVVPPWLLHGRVGDTDLTGAYIQNLTTKGSLLGWFWKKFVRFTLLGDNPHQAPSPRVLDGPFLRYYEPFDGYANRLSGLYRGAFLLNYILGVLAVAIALAGSAFHNNVDPEAPVQILHWSVKSDVIEKLFVSTELFTIGVVLLNLFLLRKQRWHYRSVDCRYLSEQFRVLCYLHTLALSPPHPRLPAHHLEHNVQKSWMEWLLRGIVRETPMTKGKFSKDRLECERTKMLGWVRGQIQYHKLNAVKLELIDRRLRVAVWASLVVIVLAGLFHLFGSEGKHPQLIAWFLIAIAAGFPAFSAACHAIASQGEFERLAERSKAMHESLEVAAKELRNLGAKGGFTIGDFREVARAIAELAVEEVVDWQILYRKPVPPP